MVELDNETTSNLLNEADSEINESPFYNEKSINQMNIEKDIGIIYVLFSCGKSESVPVYVGKSKGEYFKTRLKAHFYNIGKGTKNKFEFIQKERKSGRDVKFKYIQTKPNSLRNLIEELFIEKYLAANIYLWNYK
jgi:hypothetical protein